AEGFNGVGKFLSSRLYPHDILVSLVSGWIGYVQLFRNDDGPFVGTGNSKQPVFARRYWLAADDHRVSETDGRGLVGACAPDFPERNQVAKDLPAFYARS